MQAHVTISIVRHSNVGRPPVGWPIRRGNGGITNFALLFMLWLPPHPTITPVPSRFRFLVFSHVCFVLCSWRRMRQMRTLWRLSRSCSPRECNITCGGVLTENRIGFWPKRGKKNKPGSYFFFNHARILC